MGAVLEDMVASLGKEGLEGTPGLFGTLLSAVSTRLDSPQPPVRSPPSPACSSLPPSDTLEDPI